MSRARAFAVAAIGVVVALAAACDGQQASYVFSEPLRVRSGQFFAGELPGAPPVPVVLTGDGGAAPAPAPASGPPVVTAIQTANTVIFSGEGGKQLSGRATASASSVAIRFADLGTGYWVVPMGNPDPLYPGELGWGALTDFNASIPPGNHPLRVVAIDGNGAAGTQGEQIFCVASRLPSNPGSTFPGDITACVPTTNPPEAVISLTWDADVDLDLHVVTPAGLDVSPKHPLVDPVDSGVQPARTDARIDRDSLARCVPDGLRQEDLVFPTRPAAGSIFDIHANLFDACGKASVTFTVTVYEPEGTLSQDRHLVQTFQRSGRLGALDADGDAPGLFVAQYPF